MPILPFFCHATTGYGDIFLTLKIINFLDIKVFPCLFILLDDEVQQIGNVKEIIENNLKVRCNIAIYKHKKYILDGNLEAIKAFITCVNNTKRLIITPQSNLSLSVLFNILNKNNLNCNFKYDSDTSDTDLNILGILEYNDDNTNVENKTINLGINEFGVFLNKRILKFNTEKLNILKTKWLNYFKDKLKDKLISKIIVCYVIKEHINSFLILLSHIYKEEKIVIIAGYADNSISIPDNFYLISERFPPKSFEELISISSNPIGVTGDQSLMDAISAKKIFYYDNPSWKENLNDNLIQYCIKHNFKTISNWLEEYGDENFNDINKEEVEKLTNQICEDYCTTEEKIIIEIMDWVKNNKHLK